MQKQHSRRVLITGATGFVGSFVAKALIAAGYTVFATCLKNDNYWRLEKEKNKITWFETDGSLLSLSKIFESGSFMAVIHLATLYGGNSNYHESKLVSTNVLFPLNLLTLASQNGVRLFLNTDTFYNTKELKYSNLRGYALSKRQFWEWLNLFSEMHGMRVINLKLFHVYGSLDADNKFVPSIIRSCLKAENIPMTSGKQVRDFVYVRDVADAFMTVLSKELEDNSTGLVDLDVGTGRRTSIREFVEKVNALVGGKAMLAFGELPDRPGEDSFPKANLEKISHYGWHNKIELDTGIQLVVDWLRESEKEKS